MTRADFISASCAEIEISIEAEPGGGDRWRVEFRIQLPLRDTETRVRAPAVVLPREALLDCERDAAEYGRVLSKFLFGDPDLRAAFSDARAVSAGRLRLRLSLGPTASELRALRWETMRDPDRMNAPLFTDPNIIFSRRVYGASRRDKIPFSCDLRRVLLVAANPVDLDNYDLSSIDVASHIERLSGALADITLTTVVSERSTLPTQRATLARFAEVLREGVDVLYLVAHGRLSPKLQPTFFLEDEQGRTARVSGAELAQVVLDLERPPRLAVLATCESAGQGNAISAGEYEAATSLAIQLVEAGIAAVVAMQGRVRARTLEQFTPVFFRSLVSDGLIDRATALARAAVSDPNEAWRPALFLQLQSGRLWTAGDAEPAWRDIALTPEKFFRPWLDPAKGHNHCWAFIGREPLCEELVREIIERGRRILVLEGRGGIGKSRLVLELARKLASRRRRVLFLRERGDTSQASLERLPEGDVVLMLDDAHRIDPSELDAVADFVARRRPEATLLFSCRPPGVKMIQRACSNAGFDLGLVYHRLLANLTPSERVCLAAEALGPVQAGWAEQLAAKFPDSPLFITIGGLLMRQGRISVDELRSEDSLRRLVFARFPHNAAEASSDAQLQAVVAGVALLSPLSSRDLPVVYARTGLDPVQAARIAQKLLELGVLADVNGRIRILPDLYGSYAILDWTLPGGVPIGRMAAWWSALQDDRERHTTLRNLLEVMREVASVQEYDALRDELSKIWSEQSLTIADCDDARSHYVSRYVEMMAGEMRPEAIALAERLSGNLERTAPRSALRIELVRAVLQHLKPSERRLQARGMALLVRFAKEEQRGRALQLLGQFSSKSRFADDVLDCVEEALGDADCPDVFVGSGIDAITRAFRSKIEAAKGIEGEILDLAECHGRVTSRLLNTAFAGPPQIRSEVLRSLMAVLFVEWERWIRSHSIAPDLCTTASTALLMGLDRRLAETTDRGLRVEVRRALREGAWSAGPPVAGALLDLLRRHGQIDELCDIVDTAHVPFEEFEARVHDRPHNELFSNVELLRSMAILRLLRSAPDLTRLCGCASVPGVERILEVLIEDAILRSPAWLVQCAESWVIHTCEDDGAAAVLRSELSRYWPGWTRIFKRLATGYSRSRLGEVYACAVVHHSDATRAVVAAHVHLVRDLPGIVARARNEARRLLHDEHDAGKIWRILRRTVEELPSDPSRLYVLLHELVAERPALAAPLARQIVEDDLAEIDTLAPLLQALRRHDPDAARVLACELVEAGSGGASAVAAVLVPWVAEGGDEKTLVRALIRSENADIAERAHTAAGVLASRRPEEADEFMPTSSGGAGHIESWMLGFLNGHLVAGNYAPQAHEYIDGPLALVGREFAMRRVHPEGNLSFAAESQFVVARLSWILAGAGEPAWSAVGPARSRMLMVAVVAGGGLERPQCQRFVVEYIRRAPAEGFSAFLDALAESGTPVRVPESLVQAALKPLVGKAVFEVVADVLIAKARCERAGSPVRTITADICKGFLDYLAPVLLQRIEDDPDEECLLNVAHLLRTVEFYELVQYHKLIQVLHQRARRASRRCLHLVSKMTASIDARSIESELWGWEPEDLGAFVARVEGIVSDSQDNTSTRELFGELLKILHQQYARVLRETQI